MQYISHYTSPLGEILLAAHEQGLTGLWFEGQKYFARSLDKDAQEQELPVFAATKRWLDLYFSGREPEFMPPLRFTGTAFQNQVWALLAAIPYGQTTTYGELAKTLAARQGRASLSAQAVGGAVGKNPLSILIPCHRVVGSKGGLTGYAGGLEKKMFLLELEGIQIDRKKLQISR